MSNKPGRIKPTPPDTGFRGQFGFRNREGSSGLDPLDTQMEMGRAQGLFIKNLLGLNLRTRNPVALLLMIFGALVLLVPACLAILTLFDPGPRPAYADGGRGIAFQTVCCVTPFIIVGGLLLTNAVLSLWPAPKRLRRRKRQIEEQEDEEEA